MSSSRPPRVLFVHMATLGLKHDALVFARAIQRAVGLIEFYSLELPGLAYAYQSLDVPQWLREAMPFDLAVFLEHLPPCEGLYDETCCLRRVFVPNTEWIIESDEQLIGQYPLDAVLYKTAQTRATLEELPAVKRVPTRAVTGWTSIDIAGEGAADADAIDFTSFLHLRGVSVQKQTDVVIETWLQNPDLPSLTIVASARDEFPFSVPVPLRAAANLTVLLRRLETGELHRLQRQHGVHVCPSLAEGFGHSINEARACGAVLVTTDGPPMSEFVVAGVSGMLVPVVKEDITTFKRAPAYPVRSDNLARVVREVMAMPIADRKRMGAAAREQFLHDKEAFERAVGDLFAVHGPLPLAGLPPGEVT